VSRLTLVTGGARSGKSSFAERLALAGRAPVLYLATAEAQDDEMAARIAEHRRRRPDSWSTLEATHDIATALAGLASSPGTVLLEDLSLLASNLLLARAHNADPTVATLASAEAALTQELEALERTREAGGWELIVVTNEVGLGVVPPTPLGRVYRDLLGRANQACAARADDVYLIVAGIPLCIKRDGTSVRAPFL
jgi:adenosylcobinamide kinase/adenosylcobinamide-phosphate guanylyltransferase